MLVVIEAPGKIKKIREYSGCKVVATFGHYRDLPDKELGVDTEKLEPHFVPKEAKPGLIKDLVAQAKGEDVIIASDPDREGYAIGMMVWQDIKKVAKSVKRAEFREISAKVVKHEIANAVPMEQTNLHLYDAFLGRRVGDRLIGYLLSPVASKALGRGSKPWSVGRVQSPAIKLVVDREREIRDFRPGKYYLVGIKCEKDDIHFTAWYSAGKFEIRAEAESLLAKITARPTAKVLKVECKKRQESPKPPFETASLQMAASSQLSFSPDKTMKLAQDLYQAGLTTYHRTDSVRIAPDFIEDLRQHITAVFGPGYVPASPQVHKTKDSQADAHEGVRPTKVHDLSKCANVVAGESLTDDHAKLYELIAKRTMASQMANAEYDTTMVLLDCAGEEFKANGRVLTFPGFKKLWSAEEETSDAPAKDDAQATEADQKMPELVVSEVVAKTSQVADEKTTKAPPRYTEASLVDKLKKLGIGRPSTYATIMKGIKDREYIEIKARKLHATERGERLAQWLESTANWIVDFEMTKKLEEFLDKVEAGTADWKKLMERILFRIKESGGSTDVAPHRDAVEQQDRALSEKQLALINRHADDKIKQAAQAGDFTTCRKWIDDFFAEKAQTSKPNGKKPSGKAKRSRTTKTKS